MRARLLAIAACGGIAVASIPAHATAPKPQITDPAGDANGVNGQGFVTGLPSAPTPADASNADITSVLFQSTFKTKKVHNKVVKVPTGFTVTMTLSGAPTTPEVFYRVLAVTTKCPASVFFEYGTDVATGGSTVRCPGTPPAKDITYSDANAVVKGSTITWTLPLSAFPVGTTFSSLAAHTRFNPAIITAPQIDEATSSATFTVGK
jgi:hypothetical protein